MEWIFITALKWALLSVGGLLLASSSFCVGWWLGSAAGYYDGIVETRETVRRSPVAEPSEN